MRGRSQAAAVPQRGPEPGASPEPPPLSPTLPPARQTRFRPDPNRPTSPRSPARPHLTASQRLTAVRSTHAWCAQPRPPLGPALPLVSSKRRGGAMHAGSCSRPATLRCCQRLRSGRGSAPNVHRWNGSRRRRDGAVRVGAEHGLPSAKRLRRL